MTVTNNFKKDKDKEIETMLGLLREVYDFIEMRHLTDTKLLPVHDNGFKKSLSGRIFGYLQSKDQTFRDKVIKRQNKWIKYVEPKFSEIHQHVFNGGELTEKQRLWLFKHNLLD